MIKRITFCFWSKCFQLQARTPLAYRGALKHARMSTHHFILYPICKLRKHSVKIHVSKTRSLPKHHRIVRSGNLQFLITELCYCIMVLMDNFVINTINPLSHFAQKYSPRFETARAKPPQSSS